MVPGHSGALEALARLREQSGDANAALSAIEALAANAQNPEQKAEHWLAAHSVDSLRLDLVRALESLPPHYREIILLRDFEELSIRELTQQLALTPAAVKSRLHRARQLMREYLLA